MTSPPSMPAQPIAPGVDGGVRDALDALLTFSVGVRTELLEGVGHAELFSLARAALRRLLSFTALAVLSIDDDGLGFSLRDCDPPAAAEAIEDEVARLEADGTFGWALCQNRPVLVPSLDGAAQTFLQALPARAGVQGAIVGVVGPGLVPEVSLKLATLVTLEYASAIELGAVYRKLSESHRDLEDKVALRTRQLSEALDAARAAERAKGVFLANMTHELRTPLNGVIGMTALLLDTGLTPTQRDFVDTVRVSGEHLLRVVNDILDLSKAEDGKMRLESIAFDLRECLEGALDFVSENAHAKGLELVLAMPPTVPSAVVGDPGRLRQVLVNLVGNAVKFTERGEVIVRARVMHRPASDPREALVRVEVVDTGIGLSAEDGRRLFEPFQQADASTSRRFGGTGLGLSICKRIAELMGGAVGFTSVPGRGSTFWFTARLTLRDELTAPPSALRGRRALLVMPHDTSRGAVREMLTTMGVEVEPCAGASQALQSCAELRSLALPVDVIAVDRDVRGTTAAALIAALRERLGAETPALLIAPVVGGDIAVDESRGPTAVVFKPVKRSALLGRLNAFFGGPEAPRSAPSSPRAARRALKVLVADDNAINRKVALALLERFGCRVDLVTNGLEAVEAVEAARYDLVFMDCHMPVLDGYSASRRIRAAEGTTKRTPIVALTAVATDEDRTRFTEAGMDDFLAKPLLPDALERMLARRFDDGA